MKNKKLTGYPSIDKPWMKYYPNVSEIEQAKDESMYQMLERCCSKWLDDTALEMRMSVNDYDEGIKISYRQFLSRIKDCAMALIALGVQPNEIVPLMLPNIPESRILIYALNYIGATAYPISPMLSPSVFLNILNENHTKTLIMFGAFWEKYSRGILNSGISQLIYVTGLESAAKSVRLMAKISGKMSVPNDLKNNKSIRTYTYESFVSKKRELSKEIVPYYNKGHIAVIIGTSGTTGTPKGVCLSDHNLNSLAIGEKISDHYRRSETGLDILIQSIGYGVSTMHSFSCIGLHTVMVPELVTDKLPALLCKVKPDCFPGGPVHYINIARSKEYSEGKIPYIRGYSGGASLEKVIEMKLNNVSEGYVEKDGDKLLVRQGYGSTECCGAAIGNIYGSYKFGSIGIPMANILVSIFKPGTDEECKYGEEGEICVCGDTVMTGYLNNKSETDLVLKRHSDGKIWLHQGDLGWCDEEGHFFMTDRIKNIFMRTGFNVHPSKITEFISSLSYISECAVIGVPDSKEQMVPAAYMVINPDCKEGKDSIWKSVQKECENNLSETDIPVYWYFVDNIPRNAGGKIDNNKLKEMIK